MAEQEQEQSPAPSQRSRRPFGLKNDAGTTAVLIGALLVGLVVLSFALWSTFGRRLLAEQHFSVTPESIEITPPPEWVVADVRSQAITLGSLSDLNIQQEDLTLRVARAFSLHPWVASVKRVSKKYPARVVVELVYRRPAAVVEMPQGLYPVDTAGVLLPTNDFQFICESCGKRFAVQTQQRTCDSCSAKLVNVATQYPRLWARDTAPLGQPGANWGDQRIHAGAKLATALRPLWKRLGLYRIVARNPSQYSGQPQRPMFELVTRNNTIIYWGRAPGEEIDDEPTADKKVSRLVDFVRQHGSLDAIEPGRSIDLRDPDQLQVATKEEVELLE